MGQSHKDAPAGRDVMIKKHRPRRTASPRPVPPAETIADSEAEKSVGAALDEVGFQPLGRRIIVGGGAVRGNRQDSKDSDNGEKETPVDVKPPDTPLR